MKDWRDRYDELHQLGQPMPGPWTWEIEDCSEAILCGGGEDAIIGSIMAVRPCRACAGRAAARNEDWEWGSCLTPSLENALLIAASPALLEVALALVSDELPITEIWKRAERAVALSQGRA